jgi:hypothetical protein
MTRSIGTPALVPPPTSNGIAAVIALLAKGSAGPILSARRSECGSAGSVMLSEVDVPNSTADVAVVIRDVPSETGADAVTENGMVQSMWLVEAAIVEALISIGDV